MNIGIIAPESTSHVYVLSSVGKLMVDLGHQVTYFGFLEFSQIPKSMGLNFYPILPEEYPLGKIQDLLGSLQDETGLAGVVKTVKLLGELAGSQMKVLPEAFKECGIDALIADQISPAAKTISELLNIPFVSICNAIHLNQDINVPPVFTPWDYKLGFWYRLRNRIAYCLQDLSTAYLRRKMNGFRLARGLKPSPSSKNNWSELGLFTQLPECLDFPFANLPPSFHYVGQLNLGSAADYPWPEDELDGRPLVYASFGTVVNGDIDLLQTLLNHFESSPYQLLLSLGGNGLARSHLKIPEGVIVADRVPQLLILKRYAKVFISHCGANSAIEGIRAAIPILGIPLTNDQLGMGARIKYHQLGRIVSKASLQKINLDDVIRNLLEDVSLKNRLRSKSQQILETYKIESTSKLIADTLLKS